MGLPGPSTGRKALYTAEERIRRDSSKWTVVQGVLAAFQFLVFLVSLALVIRTLLTGEGAFAANASVIFKTLVLYIPSWSPAPCGRRTFRANICLPQPSSGKTLSALS